MVEVLNTINQPNAISAKTMSLHDLVVWLHNVNGKFRAFTSRCMCFYTVSAHFDDYEVYVYCCNHKINKNVF